MKALCIGDFHIPERAKVIPQWIKDIIEKENFDVVFCTGDLTGEEVKDYLENIGKEVYCVKGNMDYLDLPHHAVVEKEGKKILLLHGTELTPRGNKEQLYEIAKNYGADIVIHGHTHKLDVDNYKGVLMINPGTATGVWGGATDGEPETFIILEIVNGKVKVRIFKDGKEMAKEI